MTNHDILKEYEAHKIPVPSYEEWQRIFHYAGKYEYEYTSCVMDYENLKQENQQLKELLKRVNEHFEWIDRDEPFYINDELWEDIKKAIGEK